MRILSWVTNIEITGYDQLQIHDTKVIFYIYIYIYKNQAGL